MAGFQSKTRMLLLLLIFKYIKRGYLQGYLYCQIFMKNIGVIYTLLRYQQGFYYRSFQFLRVHLTQIISSIIFDTQYRIPVKNEKP